MTGNDGEGYLGRIYEVTSAEAMRDYYADWADSYESEVAKNGYVTPVRCAEALARCVSDRHAPLIDIGCGTGLSGEAFRAAGFTLIDGTDITAEMLEKARMKRLYRALVQTDADTSLPFEPGAHANAAAVGVFSPQHAPPALIDEVMGYVPRGGRFVFSLNDHALADPSYEGKIMELTDSGAAEVEFREYGPHLPEIGLKSIVYVLRRM